MCFQNYDQDTRIDADGWKNLHCVFCHPFTSVKSQVGLIDSVEGEGVWR